MISDQAHLSVEQLAALARGVLDSDERGTILQHLLAGCSRCSELLAGATSARVRSAPRGGLRWRNSPPVESAAGGEQRYGPTVRRAFDAALREAEHLLADRVDAGGRLELLLEQPRRQQLLLRNSRRYRSAAVCSELLRRSFAERFRDPELMLRLAQLGVQVAEGLGDEDLRPAVRFDLCAEAWAYLGNARRVSSDLSGADEAMQRAFARLRMGLGDPYLEARLLTFLASLRGDQRRFAECTGALVKACGLYRLLDERHLLGRTLIIYGGYRGAAEGLEPARGRELLEEGLALIDCAREPGLVVLAMHNLVTFTAHAGRYLEAWELLRECRGLYRRHLGPLACIKLLWLEGSIAMGLGRWQRAAQALTRARVQLQVRGLGYDVALVSLELASLELRRDRDVGARLLVEESWAILRAEGIDREALAAVLLLREAMQKQQRPLEMLRQVMAFLRHREIDSRARFTPPRP